MAAANPAKRLREEASCSICSNYFTDPVTLNCGHNFCYSCITPGWEGLDTDFPCPQCRETSQKRNLRPNRQLANVIEYAKTFCPNSVKHKKEDLCEKHEEELKLFCKEDQIPICVVCGKSRDHRPHNVIPIKEALQEYKEPLRKQLEELLTFKSNEEKAAELLKSETEIKRQKIVSEFEELLQILKKEKKNLLSRLEKKMKKILQKIKENVTQLEKQTFSLTRLISEIEKSQQPAAELLKDVKDTLSRYQKGQFPESKAVSTDLNMGIHLSYPEQLKTCITRFGGLDWRMGCARYAVDVTLDPETAHPTLRVSEDQKVVTCGDTEQKVTNIPQRFDSHACVLGCEGFTSGRYYWEVEVGDATAWMLGVCKASVRRKGKQDPSPEEGYWIIWLYNGEYRALTSPMTLLPLRVRPQAVGILLDYRARKVSFYNADNKSHLFTFTHAFTETLQQFFGLYKGTLRICPVPASK
ncbi:E3 ubiquitin-protein ligase TRIM39-like isoform X1 [Rhinatrema bivittatum]|uniref:E3 ubiquitin-protein ligase TRIM39-like isoform X1 n=1 Tax=Rhinatrema bivittatum TaxID=194408 RepID=UPI00112A2DAE|nr:E3 ubiquitin-protein ligase TRIM39-like isoform X1 [Rhinatrema bivittatum]